MTANCVEGVEGVEGQKSPIGARTPTDATIVFFVPDQPHTEVFGEILYQYGTATVRTPSY